MGPYVYDLLYNEVSSFVIKYNDGEYKIIHTLVMHIVLKLKFVILCYQCSLFKTTVNVLRQLAH